MKLIEKIGRDGVRAVVADFYERVFGDVMIGFMFEGKNKLHLVEREWEFACGFLGDPDIKYTGRPMRTAHAGHTIFGGHFERRLQILRETLRDHAVDADVQQAWIEHTQALRAQITRDKGSECKDTGEGHPKLAIAVDSNPDKPIKLGRR